MYQYWFFNCNKCTMLITGETRSWCLGTLCRRLQFSKSLKLFLDLKFFKLITKLCYSGYRAQDSNKTIACLSTLTKIPHTRMGPVALALLIPTTQSLKALWKTSHLAIAQRAFSCLFLEFFAVMDLVLPW